MCKSCWRKHEGEIRRGKTLNFHPPGSADWKDLNNPLDDVTRSIRPNCELKQCIRTFITGASLVPICERARETGNRSSRDETMAPSDRSTERTRSGNRISRRPVEWLTMWCRISRANSRIVAILVLSAKSRIPIAKSC